MDHNTENMNNTEVVAEETTEVAAEATEQKNGKGFAIASLVCGILGIVGSFIPVIRYFALVLAILGIVFGVKARKIEKNGMATAGLVCGIVAAACGVVAVLSVICAVGLYGVASLS